MTLGELKAYLATCPLPDETEIVVSSRPFTWNKAALHEKVWDDQPKGTLAFVPDHWVKR